ncbi:hypothetical protein DACRYDRAFT_113142 [Dacryopinax primogenitus]|uniref:RING-type E3 ubiquitin transferase (cysteine targeting) n=1 Tax=Dacryopinax primogenitus (strain DJM 731) TaxID=1858805 RepID=M5GFL8_DACPD|nr:uncharacterized protein DACRYDRAFT_113142 [Dacryopinax primogenitus]EJU06432.1 hypothetical protein DACRYDRAFT_113142 [Dacryopinax primogenitus]
MSLPTSWQSSWASHIPQLTAIQRTLGSFRPFPHHIPRIGQLDADLLDEELAQVLQEPLTKALQGLQSSWRGLFTLELGLLIRLILYKLSIWDNAASYGAQLQGLKLVDAHAISTSNAGPGEIRRQKLFLHALLTLGVPYLHARIRGYALSRAWPDRPRTDQRRLAWACLTSAENAHAVLGLAGFVTFLWDGRYRTITDRILGLRLVSSRRVDRVISYEYMNRQIVWHALTEFLLFLVPLVDVAALRRGIRQYLLSLRKSTYVPSLIKGLLERDPTTSSSNELKGPYTSLPPTECAICAERAALPNISYPLSNQLTASTIIGAFVPSYPVQTTYVGDCGHSYCYVCLTEKMVQAADEGKEGWRCLRCGKTVKSAARLKPVEEGEVIDGSEEDLGDPDATAAS